MFDGILDDSAQLALDTILQRPVQGIPTYCLFLMEHSHIERLAGVEPGSYQRDPEAVYLACMQSAGVCLIDQYIPTNPLTMGDRGFEGAERGATTGAERIVRDGIVIDTPEAVVSHLEQVVFPRLQQAIASFDQTHYTSEVLQQERALQATFGTSILKTGYGFAGFPALAYDVYGYVHYFQAYALYPDVMERHFSLQADLALLRNRAAASAYVEGGLPPLFRLDHDMADSRGTLVSIASLERIWFPHLTRCLEPLLDAEVRLIWHCDGNLMQMVPRLLEAGISGFQGFQYEDGMDYPRICAMRDRKGRELIIIGGVSVTRTLPTGNPSDVRREIDWLVSNGPKTGLFLGPSSSVTPGVSWENIRTFVEGLSYYRTRGRM